MPDPMRHAENRNWFESLVRMIPGFHGYLEKQYRRESDALARKWLADRLDRGKKGLDELMRELVEAGRLPDLNKCERLRTKIDKLVGRYRSAPAGYSGLFDFVKVREDRLDQVYALDVAMMEGIDKLSNTLEKLGSDLENVDIRIKQLTEEVESADKQFDKRAELLNGLES